jgi:hypothetical protein
MLKLQAPNPAQFPGDDSHTNREVSQQTEALRYLTFEAQRLLCLRGMV